MMEWIANFATYQPLSQQLVRFIKQKINNEEIMPRTILPSIDDLSKHYGVSRWTVKEAFEKLYAEGLITSTGTNKVIIYQIAEKDKK